MQKLNQLCLLIRQSCLRYAILQNKFVTFINVFLLVVQSEVAVSEAGEPAPSVAPGEEEEGKEEVTIVNLWALLRENLSSGFLSK